VVEAAAPGAAPLLPAAPVLRLSFSIRSRIPAKSAAPFLSPNASQASQAGTSSCLAKSPYPTIQPPWDFFSLKRAGVPGAHEGFRLSDGRQKLTSS
jgi:hypothetical protein